MIESVDFEIHLEQALVPPVLEQCEDDSSNSLESKKESYCEGQKL